LEIISEVVFMTKIIAMLILFTLWVTPYCCELAKAADGNLIPVKPSYSEATYTPQSTDDSENSGIFPSPTPRDQMYIFWILGKVLSYPIDKTESFIMSKIRRPQGNAVATPASAANAPNPFTQVNWREIPPAPPAQPR
jgi:hypothetical protein